MLLRIRLCLSWQISSHQLSDNVSFDKKNALLNRSCVALQNANLQERLYLISGKSDLQQLDPSLSAEEAEAIFDNMKEMVEMQGIKPKK